MRKFSSLVEEFLLSEEEQEEVLPPNFPPKSNELPPGAPTWMKDWADDGNCQDCDGEGHLKFMDGSVRLCRACNGYGKRNKYYKESK